MHTMHIRNRHQPQYPCSSAEIRVRFQSLRNTPGDAVPRNGQLIFPRRWNIWTSSSTSFSHHGCFLFSQFDLPAFMLSCLAHIFCLTVTYIRMQRILSFLGSFPLHQKNYYPSCFRAACVALLSALPPRQILFRTSAGTGFCHA